mgnify:CR=1
PNIVNIKGIFFKKAFANSMGKQFLKRTGADNTGTIVYNEKCYYWFEKAVNLGDHQAYILLAAMLIEKG